MARQGDRSIAEVARSFGVSESCLQRWLQANPISQRDWEDAQMINAAIDIHHDDPDFGYRYIADELADQGVRASRNRVNRLCSSQRLWSVHSAARRP